MALLTDGNPNDTAALQIYESAILNVAAIEKIDLDVKLGLATEEISEDVLNILLDHTRTSDPQSNVRRTMGVSDVVVTPPMKRWQAAHTLEMVYRDAFHNQLNDRYQAKVNEYHDLSRQARENTLKLGIGLASNPIPKAATPVLSHAAGLTAATTYYAAVSWVSALGQEGAPSDVTAFTTTDGSALVVQAANPPGVATGFKVYLGLTAEAMMLQTATPVAIGLSFTLPGGELTPGATPGNGQMADVFVIGGSTLRRG